MTARVWCWPLLALIDWALLLTLPIAAPVVVLVYWLCPWSVPALAIGLYWGLVAVIPAIALFARAQPHGMPDYTWGWLWGTYDNPPQGDEGFVDERAFFGPSTTGWRGYLNRVHWMLRNPLYGYAKLSGVLWEATHAIRTYGNPNISDKYKIPGWLFAVARNMAGQVVAFELYVVAPWLIGRCLRMRLGWKITTSKVHEYGFAQLVNTLNPFDGYGEGAQVK